MSGVRASDFVSQYLSQTGLGSLIITGAANSNGTGLDTTARLYVSSRIWTLQPNSNGTVSQTFPAIPLSTVNTTIAGLFAVSSATAPENYRVNVGIVNVDPSLTQTFAINVAGSSTITTDALESVDGVFVDDRQHHWRRVVRVSGGGNDAVMSFRA